MTTDTTIEIVSPLSHTDTDCVCRVARMPGLVATCAGCGETVYRRVHLPLIAFGFWCSRCCPCRTFAPTPEEVDALRANRANRARPDAGSKSTRERRADERLSHKAKTVVPGESVAERRARFKQRLADAARARWADPVQRAELIEALSKASRRRWGHGAQ